jgi:hypothetical protein
MNLTSLGDEAGTAVTRMSWDAQSKIEVERSMSLEGRGPMDSS